MAIHTFSSGDNPRCPLHSPQNKRPFPTFTQLHFEAAAASDGGLLGVPFVFVDRLVEVQTVLALSGSGGWRPRLAWPVRRYCIPQARAVPQISNIVVGTSAMSTRFFVIVFAWYIIVVPLVPTCNGSDIIVVVTRIEPRWRRLERVRGRRV